MTWISISISSELACSRLDTEHRQPVDAWISATSRWRVVAALPVAVRPLAGEG